ncbi:hypothetical protein M9H77_12802 [Catharanthus roseus]|uniref:Uncharacterized protein n=1 Tax=Catharanthus roseus TaxID=4058 RepID=A0ACC0BIK2_CATRO|nr:hypothetical protein M9H77_12802 [Catharanthus roseus]
MDSSLPLVSIDRKSSIEKEPRTLNIDQIQIAREAALYVVSTRSMEEALRVFTEGLEPVMSCAAQNGGTMMDCDEQELLLSPSQLRNLRDIASAPF